MFYPIIFFTGFLASLALLFFFQQYALNFKLLNKKGIPSVGGVAMGLSFLVLFSLFFPTGGFLAKETFGIVAGAALVLVAGIIDDLIELSVPAKFLFQLAATALLMCFGVRTHIVYIGDVGNIIITLLWVIGITNALNHLDVLDGLAAGAAVISNLAFFSVALLNGDVSSALLSLLLMAVTLPFLLYNLPPARMYMGNSGSHFLGFLMAACAIVISYAPLDRKVALLTPLFVLGLPVFDTAFLIFVRLRQGRSAFKKSDDHMALRYLKQGYSKRKVLLFILLLGLFSAVAAVIGSQVPNFAGIVIFAFAGFVFLLVGIRMNRV